MKTKLFDILVEKILQCMFLLIVFVNVSYSQNTSPKEKEILAYITDGILTLPALEHEQLTIDKIKIHSIAFTKGLEKAKVKTLRKAFPEFSPSDSIRITPAGKKYSIVHFSHIFRLKINDDGDLDSAKSILSKIPGVLFAEKNMDAHLFSDTTYANQWHLNNTGQSGGLSGADIKAELAWAIFTGNPSIIIGIIDSGVETTHEDLSGKATGDLPAGAEYHGTHVAGIAAAKANNDKGGRGVDWNAQILSRRIFDAYGNYLGDVTAANQTISAVDNGAHILNHSWGGPSYSSTIRMAFSYAYEMNRTSIVAMGNNNGSQIQYPAGYGQGIIAVGSTRDDDTWSSFSDIGNHIDVAAPGGINPYPDNDKHDIWSTWGNNSYRYLAGTSMAAPVVSGIASLLKGYNTSLYNDDIEHIIQLSADDVNSSSFPAWDQYLGYGRVNARKALDLLRSPYVLEQASVTGGADVGSTGYYQTVIYGAPGLVPDVYLVKRHEVQRTVYYNNKQEVNVWGRGVASNGWSIESPNYSMGWCDAVPGTVTSTSATLRTYVYEVYDILGRSLGWYPTTPSSVVFAYTVHGKLVPLSASISGPSYLNKNQSGTWTVTASGGVPPYTYSWSVYVYCTIPYISSKTTANNVVTPDALPCDQWMSIYNTTNTETYSETRSFQLKCIVKDAVNSSYTVTKDVSVGSSPLEKKNADSVLANTKELINKESLVAYPNPFNPTTRISFSLENTGYVSLKIFDILGKEVKTLIQDRLDKGIYEYEFNGSSLPSGIYICNLTAGNKTVAKKILLAK